MENFEQEIILDSSGQLISAFPDSWGYLVFPKELIRIPESANVDRKNLKHLDFRKAKNLYEIEGDVFTDSKNLLSINLKENILLEKISDNAFSGCLNLKEIEFPGEKSCLKEIGDSSFANCLALKNIDLSCCNKLLQIKGFAFSGCKNLENLVLPQKAKLQIFVGAFSSTGIKFLTIPKNTKLIQCFAFAESKIEKLDLSKIDDSCKIMSEAFRGCPIEKGETSNLNLETEMGK